jgi:hypothetical protein
MLGAARPTSSTFATLKNSGLPLATNGFSGVLLILV